MDIERKINYTEFKHFKIFTITVNSNYIVLQADNQANLYRKVQRSNDELQEQIENLQVQLHHTQSR